MATFKNATDYQIDIPLYDLHVAPGGTFEVPEEVAYSFDANPLFASSRVRKPDVTVDQETVAAVTGPVPIQPSPDVPVPPTA